MKLHYEDDELEVDLISNRHSIADHPKDAPTVPFAFKAHGFISRSFLESLPQTINRIIPPSRLADIIHESDMGSHPSYEEAERVLLNCAAAEATSVQIKETMEALLVYYEDAKAMESENDALNDKAEQTHNSTFAEED